MFCNSQQSCSQDDGNGYGGYLLVAVAGITNGNEYITIVKRQKTKVMILAMTPRTPRWKGPLG